MFSSAYGDYDGIAITNVGKTVSIAGEGASFSPGPGSISTAGLGSSGSIGREG